MLLIDEIVHGKSVRSLAAEWLCLTKRAYKVVDLVTGRLLVEIHCTYKI